MEVVNQILLVNKDTVTNTETNSKIKSAKIAQSVKVALNGGHALLYLEQISERLKASNLVILLSMDTPIMNGYEFLNSYFSCKSINKESILLIVLKDNLTEEKIQSLKAKGISNFIDNNFEPSALAKIIFEHFTPGKEFISNGIKLRNKYAGPEQMRRMNAA